MVVVDIVSITGGGFEGIVEHATNNQVITTINDNDTPTLSIGNVAVTEEADPYAVFTLSLSNASVEDVEVSIGPLPLSKALSFTTPILLGPPFDMLTAPAA